MTTSSPSPAREQKGGCQLIITEQGVFLDDFDDARGCEHGTRVLMDQLENALQR
jgi:hypothetical protein